MAPVVSIRDLHKAFTLHSCGSFVLPVLSGVCLDVAQGDCVALEGPSGSGKSTLLLSIHGNYKPQMGQILVRHKSSIIDVTKADPRFMLDVRSHTIGHVDQVLPAGAAICAINIVAESLHAMGLPGAECRDRAETMLRRMGVPDNLWTLPAVGLPPLLRQKVNIARGFAAEHPVLLLDEPETALDGPARLLLAELILDARERGAAIIGIFRDPFLARRVATRRFDLGRCKTMAEAAQ